MTNIDWKRVLLVAVVAAMTAGASELISQKLLSNCNPNEA